MRRARVALTGALGLGLGLGLGACGRTHASKDDAQVSDDPPGVAPDDAGSAPRADAAMLAPCTPRAGTAITVRKLAEPVVGGAVLATAPPGDDRLFVVEQRGAIRIYHGEQLAPAAFLDLSDEHGGPVVAGGELGLLGLAFHPQYAQNGQLFVFYTARKLGDPDHVYADVLARYHVSPTDPDRAALAGTIVLAIDDFTASHNGGMIEFGPDGYLYIGTGDGGGQGDPQRNGQNPGALLGKILRIDVDHPAAGKPYGIPADNPFAAGGGAPEVFVRGLRNPWRWSFDRATGDLWIGDVGEAQVEELDVLPAGAQRGANLGWSAYEGTSCCATQPDRCLQTGAAQACDPAGQTFALDERPHASGWNAIVGGQVYRGACYPDLVGWYLYTDFVHGGLAKARQRPDGTLEIVDLPDPGGAFPAHPSSLHADARGELYETDTAGNVYHVEAGPEPAARPAGGAAR
jgi:glucose/arabinose dehydrogenase